MGIPKGALIQTRMVCARLCRLKAICMAIYHFSAGIVQRSKGQSAIAAAAYRAAMRLTVERTGEVYDYRAKGHVAHAEIVMPAGAPAWCSDRAALWNRAEAAETKANAQVARKLDVALPRELNFDQNLELTRELARGFADLGMVVDFALHDPDAADGEVQPHAHLLMTMRALDPATKTGFTKAKGRGWNDVFTDEDGFKKDKTGAQFVARTKGLEGLRLRWAEMLNRHLEAAGVAERVDHRNLKDQWADAVSRGDVAAAEKLERDPESKIGAAAARRAQRGQVADRVAEVEEIRKNRRAVVDLATERASRRRVEDRRRRVEERRAAMPAISLAVGQQDAKQRYKLRLLAQAYEAAMPDRLAIDIAWVRARDPRSEIVVQIRDGARIRDDGRRISAQGEADSRAIQIMVEMARARGWKSVRLQGSDEFRLAAAAQLERAGICIDQAPSPESGTNFHRLRPRRRF